MGAAIESSVVHNRRRHGSAKYHSMLHGTYHGSMDGAMVQSMDESSSMAWSMVSSIVHSMASSMDDAMASGVHGIVHGRRHGIVYGRCHGLGVEQKQNPPFYLCVCGRCGGCEKSDNTRKAYTLTSSQIK